MAAAVELNDGTTALFRDRPLPPNLKPVRLAHHHVDLAPHLVRYHPSVHETIAVLAETERRHSDTLAGFAHWADVTYTR